MAGRKFSKGLTVFACILALIVGLVAGFFLYTYLTREEGGDVLESGTEIGSSEEGSDSGSGSGSVYESEEISFHFMELGNGNSGDSIYIKAGDTDILIDAGSARSSAATTAAYMEQYVTDGTLEYVIVTHADEDHIAGFAGSSTSASMFDRFTCEVIIDFPRTDKTTNVYSDYCTQREEAVAEGAAHYTALECWNNENGAQRVWEVSDGIEMQVLYNYYYEHSSSDENNYSVCVLFSQGDKHFLFTGDLEREGEEYLVQYNDLPQVELFKAGHHGSYSSSNDCLLDVIQPKIVCVCCCAGNVEYLPNATSYEDLLHSFPAQESVERIAKWTDQVYVTTLGHIYFDEEAGKYRNDGYTSMNGNIVVTSDREGVTVQCSNNNTLLKDTDWFKKNRKMPEAWA